MAFVILEDDDERFIEMSRILREAGFARNIARFKRADDCITWLSENLPSVVGLSLDHDLIDERPGEPDPGDGRQVAEWLARQQIKPPVVIHSSNFAGAEGMYFCLKDASFTVHRVYPLGDDWIKSEWKTALKNPEGGF